MQLTFENLLITLAFILLVAVITELISSKFKIESEEVFFAVLIAFAILSSSFLLLTGSIGHAWGVAPVPPWGQVIILIGCIIMLIMMIHHWCKQKKNQVLNNNDENAEAEAAQENLLADDAQQPLEDKDKNQP